MASSAPLSSALPSYTSSTADKPLLGMTIGDKFDQIAAQYPDNDALIAEKYQGIRPAPGYPACPDHTEKATLFRLLNASENTGLTLTENFAMWPAAAVSGWYFSHPQSKYFSTGKITRDQVEALAERKQMPLEEMERWLSPILSYDPS